MKGLSPRVRGNRYPAGNWGGGGQGLSPRVRGNPRLQHPGSPRRGSIPACAGEPRRGGGAGQYRAVYPRVCGGTPPSRRRRDNPAGLSPRVRGNRSASPKTVSPAGSIPACAGEPWAGTRRTKRWPVYPRVCGGTPKTRTASASATGLSPRVRGNRSPAPGTLAGLRSIPACAGEPAFRPVTGRVAAVYPRVCGGTLPACFQASDRPGLSPRVRGNPLTTPAMRMAPRSIPACAGEPSDRPFPRAGQWVYPRVCGGTSSALIISGRFSGLSPRVRGNRARTGCPTSPSAVYPRVCGGTHRQ